MAISIFPAGTRGVAHGGWLESKFSFSFANYHDSERMNFGALRVLNDDIIEAGYGFDMHPHSNFEIVTIPLEGQLEHRDSAGNHGIIRPGEIQRISAGSGIEHSEHNSSKTKKAKILQIWVAPKEKGITPSYEQVKLPEGKMEKGLVEIVSGFADKPKGVAYMHQNSRFLLGHLKTKQSEKITAKGKASGFYVFVISGKIRASGIELGERDAAGIEDEKSISIEAAAKSRVLVIEVPLK